MSHHLLAHKITLANYLAWEWIDREVDAHGRSFCERSMLKHLVQTKKKINKLGGAPAYWHPQELPWDGTCGSFPRVHTRGGSHGMENPAGASGGGFPREVSCGFFIRLDFDPLFLFLMSTPRNQWSYEMYSQEGLWSSCSNKRKKKSSERFTYTLI